MVVFTFFASANSQEYSLENCLKEMEDAAREATNVSAKILASRTYQKALNTQEKSQSKSRSIRYRCENASKAEDLYRSATCLLYTSPSPRDKRQSRMPSSA